MMETIEKEVCSCDVFCGGSLLLSLVEKIE